MITPLPAFPLIGDADFDIKAETALSALPPCIDEINATAAAMDAALQTSMLGVTATSSTSLTIGTGSKSLTVQTGKGFVVGMSLKIASTATPANYMICTVTSYTGGTGALVVDVATVGGSGTVAAWTVSITLPMPLVPSVPIGAVFWFAAASAPTGYLKANGAAISRTAYADLFAVIGTIFGAGDGSTTFNLPDLRGEFVRGYDDGRGVDSGRAFGSAQSDDFKSHTHTLAVGTSGTGPGGYGYWGGGNVGSPSSGATGGSETRPRNKALLACIKY